MPVYLDYASATPTDPRVIAAMLPYFTEKFGNPSSIHAKGMEAKEPIERATPRILRALNARDHDIIFTSGGTESINLAIQGTCAAHNGGHLITSAIEHHAVLETCDALQTRGFTVTKLPVDKNGKVSPDSLNKAIRPDTRLITIGLI